MSRGALRPVARRRRVSSWVRARAKFAKLWEAVRVVKSSGRVSARVYVSGSIRRRLDPSRRGTSPSGGGAPPVRRVSRTEAGQQDPGSQTSTDPAGRGADVPPDHAGPQADVAGLPDPDAGPRPDAAGRGAGRRTTSPDPGRIPAGTAGPGRVLGQGRAAPRTVVLGGVGGIHPSLLAGARVRGGGGSPAAGGTTVARARRGFREELLDAPCSRLSIVRFDTGPKRSMGHLLGGEKNNFFNSRY